MGGYNLAGASLSTLRIRVLLTEFHLGVGRLTVSSKWVMINSLAPSYARNLLVNQACQPYPFLANLDFPNRNIST